MKLILVVTIVIHAASAVSFFSLNDIRSNRFEFSRLVQEWNYFKQEHNKTYLTSEEEQTRFYIFDSNRKKINDHNDRFLIGEHSFSLKVNKFADLTNNEFANVMNGYDYSRRVRGQSATHLRLDPEIKLPKSMDWRTRGAVTPVKDQGQCGSCWAFSSTGALEGQHFRKKGKLVSLSEQNLVDCSTSFGNDGCNGGLMDDAFKYVKANGGIDTEASYPYEGADDPCRFNPQDIGATDVGYMDVEEGSEQALKECVAIHGPTSIAIDASQSSFQFYHKGIYDDPNCSSMSLDHGVLAVGYGSDETGRDYWIVKNSWAASWGDKGYIKIARNENNMCGVATSASIPLV